MKKFAMAFALLMAIGTVGFAQVPSGMDKAKMVQSAPLKSIQGTVKADGDKITFVADEDGKSWDVMNPETLKAHAGHHVEISAHVYADRGQVHVMGVKMLKA